MGWGKQGRIHVSLCLIHCIKHEGHLYMEGHIELGVTQYHNTVRKFDKYRNNESKINEILILQLFSVTFT